MATSPDLIRTALQRVTLAARREVRAVAQAAPRDAAAWRAALFASAPLVVGEYGPAAGSLGLDWFEQIREDASPPSSFNPELTLSVTDADVVSMVARNTAPLLTPALIDDLEAEFQRMLAQIEAEVQREVAQGFRDTVTTNSDDDPDAVGWRRFARANACKFCLMQAGRGAIFTEASVRFAAHTTCHCVTGQSYDPDAPRADAMQYLGAKRARTAKENARLRAYLNRQYPDAPG